MMWRREIGCDTASILASESSTQLNPELRTMDYDISAVKDEFHKTQMEKFTYQVVETIEGP